MKNLQYYVSLVEGTGNDLYSKIAAKTPAQELYTRAAKSTEDAGSASATDHEAHLHAAFHHQTAWHAAKAEGNADAMKHHSSMIDTHVDKARTALKAGSAAS